MGGLGERLEACWPAVAPSRRARVGARGPAPVPQPALAQPSPGYPEALSQQACAPEDRDDTQGHLARAAGDPQEPRRHLYPGAWCTEPWGQIRPGQWAGGRPGRSSLTAGLGSSGRSTQPGIRGRGPRLRPDQDSPRARGRKEEGRLNGCRRRAATYQEPRAGLPTAASE